MNMQKIGSFFGKILNQCPFCEQQVPQNYFLSKNICKTLNNKDMATKLSLIFLKKPYSSNKPMFWQNKPKK